MVGDLFDDLMALGLEGWELVEAVLATAHRPPDVPPEAWDGHDPGPLLARLTDAERERFKLPPAPPAPPASPLPPAPPLDQAYRVGPPSPEGGPGLGPLGAPPQGPLHTIRVHVICCANDDGSRAHADPAKVAAWMPRTVAEANAIYAANDGAKIEFTFNPLDIELRRSTMLNQDFVVPSGTNMATETRPFTDRQLDSLMRPHEDERNRVSLEYPNRCVFLLCEGTELWYDPAARTWKTVPRAGAYSGTDKEFVTFPSDWELRGPEAAHETGHYLGLWHTHPDNYPKTLDEAAAAIAQYVNGPPARPRSAGLEVFDADVGSGVLDTPPDPGPTIFGAPDPKYCAATTTVTVTVRFGNETEEYHPAPDRGKVMSYFKNCGATFPQNFSGDQIKRMRTFLEPSAARYRLLRMPPARGVHAFIQGRFGRAPHTNFELIVPLPAGGLAHYFRDNTDAAAAWFGPFPFAQGLGPVDAVSVAQTSYGDPGNLELVARAGGRLVWLWRQSDPPFAWSQPLEIASGVSGTPAFIQGCFGRPPHTNFELVAPLAAGGLAHWFRDNADAAAPWRGPYPFAQGLAPVDAVSLIQSSYGNLEVVARAGGRLVWLWRQSDPPFAWSQPLEIASGVSGTPAFRQGRFGRAPHTNFELVAPLAAGGLAHWFRDNADAAAPWRGPYPFAQGLAPVDAVSMIQSSYGRPGNLELIARVGDLPLWLWRDSGPAFAWSEPLSPH